MRSPSMPLGAPLGRPLGTPRGAHRPPSRSYASATVDAPVLEECRALVLDGSFRPITVVNWHRAVTLDVIKAVEVLEYYDCFVKTVRQDYPVPAVLRTEFVMKGRKSKRGGGSVSLSRKNIFKRDKHCCVYCGEGRELTIDHIVPLSRGGKNDWENLVTACRSCNAKKGNRSLEKMGWKLKTQPKKPSTVDLHVKIDVPFPGPKEWHDYVGHLKKDYQYL